MLKRHGYTHHRQGPLVSLLPAWNTETQGKEAAGVMVCVHLCFDHHVPSGLCLLLTWLERLPYPVEVGWKGRRVGDGVGSHWWVTRESRKLPGLLCWETAKLGIRKPHFPDLNLLVLLILPSPELWEMGLSCLESTVFVAFLLRMPPTVWESTPASPALNPHRATERCRGKQHPDWRQEWTVRKARITHCLEGREGPTGTECRCWESHSQSPALWGQPCVFPLFDNWSSGSSQTTLTMQV